MIGEGDPAAVACRALRIVLGDQTIVDGADLAVGNGEWVSLIGPNGAGKTTLLRALAGLVPATGEVEVDGHPIHRLSRRERSRLLAFVPQTPVVPAGITVADYVMLGRTPYLSRFGGPGQADHAATTAAMEWFELRSFAGRLLSSLSGGERQRVFLARALAQAAPILLLDEPTTGLDIGHQQQVLDLIDRLRRELGLTVLSTLHDLTLAGQYANRLVLVHRGRVAAAGTPAVVLTEANLEHYYDARVRLVGDPNHPAVVPLRDPVGNQIVPASAESAP